EQAGGLDQLERMVAQARVTALPGAVQDNELMRRELQRKQELLARVPPRALDRDMRGDLPPVPQTEEAQSMRRIAQAVRDQSWGDQSWAREPGAPPAPVGNYSFATESPGAGWSQIAPGLYGRVNPDGTAAAPAPEYRIDPTTGLVDQITVTNPDGTQTTQFVTRAAPGTPTTTVTNLDHPRFLTQAAPGTQVGPDATRLE